MSESTPIPSPKPQSIPQSLPCRLSANRHRPDGGHLLGDLDRNRTPHPKRQWVHLPRNALVALAGLLLGLWAIFYSGWRKLPTALAFVVLLGACATTIHIENDGDLNSSIHLQSWVLRLFGASHDDDVEEQRKKQTESLAKRPIDLTPQRGDWPGFRGRDRNGVVDGPPIARDWHADPPRELWKQLTYGGYSSFAVVNGFLFTMEQRKDNEAVVCYDADNGNELWVHEWPGSFPEAMGGSGPRSTPTGLRWRRFAALSAR